MFKVESVKFETITYPICPECKGEVLGDARLDFDGKLYHLTCLERKTWADRGYTHTCPICKGVGKVLQEYDAYPKGLPDSGWTQDIQTRKVTCEFCEGIGFLRKAPTKKFVWEK